ncbi:MAG: IclR family transcriptional regulator [Solirubrobacterales bacterium]|nr:IclR family transcriptional regulator [Solirubrobacterales bacterium]
MERQPDGAYVVGRRLWALGLLAPVSRGLRDVSLPFLQDLSATTGENAHIAVRDGLWALYVERISGRQAVPIVSRSGTRLPLHATAVEKVLLAHAPDAVAERVIRSPWRVTDRTVVDPARLLRQLGAVRRRGYALTAEEMSVGTTSVAVPVVDQDGQLLGALGVVAAATRREPARLVPVLQLAARGISRAAVPGGGR